MKLRSKTLLGIGSALIILISGLYLFSKSTLNNGFSDVEMRDSRLNTRRVIDALNAQIENLENKMIDWAAWDDPYQWIEDKNEKFVESNLGDSSVIAMKISMWAWIDSKKNIIYGKMYDEEKSYELNQEIKDFIVSNSKIYENGQEGEWKNVNGFINFKEAPMFITSQPIITSEQKGPQHGILLTGRWLNKEALEKLSKMTHLNISIDRNLERSEAGTEWKQAFDFLSKSNPNEVYIKELSESTIAGYSLVRDISDQPLFIIKMDTTRDVKTLGQKTISTLLGGIILIGLLILIFIGFLIEQFVLKRLSQLSSTVNDIRTKNDLSLRIPESSIQHSHDEISFLTQSMNSLLASQEESKGAIRRLLDNAGQGFLSFNSKGQFSQEFSKITETMLNQNPSGKYFWEIFDENQKNNIVDVIDTLFQELLSFEDISLMLPKAMTTEGNKFLEFKYRPVRDHQGKLIHVMVLISDITEIKNLEVKQENERRLNGALIKILAAPQDFANVLDELYSMESKLNSHEAFIRSMHTLKGGFGLFQCDDLAMCCHEMETMLKERTSHEFRKDCYLKVKEKTESFLESHNNILKINKGEEKTIVLPQQSIKTFMNKAIKMGVANEMLNELDQILEKPMPELLGWLDRVFMTSAEKLGKLVNPIQWNIEDHLGLNPIGYESLMRSLVHIVRNTADHGIELSEERDLAGKDIYGNLKISFRNDQNFYYLTFEDDGGGVNISKLREKIKASGIKKDLTDEEVLDRIFESGVTSKDEVSELSGRGVGLDAIRFEARKLGGDVKATTTPGKGTQIKIWFKKLSSAERCLMTEAA